MLKEAEQTDELMDESIKLVRATGRASTATIQRKFRIGYIRAKRIIDIMESRGIIGPMVGISPRMVLPDPAQGEKGQDMSDDYCPGKGCLCGAGRADDCVCDGVDWTPHEVYELRARIKELESSRDKAAEVCMRYKHDLAEARLTNEAHCRLITRLTDKLKAEGE